jgi:hypothetical protein
MKAFLACVIAALALPSAAGAALTPVIPPGNSAANQYVESVPTAGGGTSSTVVFKGGHGGRPGHASTPAVATSQSYLQRQGTDGRGLTALLRATAAPASAGSTSHRHDTHRSAAAPGGSAGGGSAGGSTTGGGSTGTRVSGTGATSGTAAVVHSLTGLGGTSPGLWVVLLVVAVGVVGTAGVRRRRSN